MQDSLVTRDNGTLQRQELTATLADEFIAYLDASPKTVETYKRAIKPFFVFMYQQGITQPTRADVLNYREALKESGHKPTTTQNYIMALRQFFKWTESAGHYPNIADHIKGAKLTTEHKKDYLTAAQVKDILANIDRHSLKGARDFAIVALMTTAGLRTIEAARANIEDLNTLDGNSVLYVQGKGRDDRSEFVIVPPEAEKAIRLYLQERGETDKTAPLFASTSNNNAGQRMTTRAISSIIKTAMQAVGLNSDRLTAHSLRHTAITLALKAGLSLQEAQQFARHSSPATTQIYAHNLEKSQNKCSRAVAKAIF